MDCFAPVRPESIEKCPEKSKSWFFRVEGRFDDAIEACNDAVTAARDSNRKVPAGIQERYRLFQSRQPYRRFP